MQFSKPIRPSASLGEQHQQLQFEAGAALKKEKSSGRVRAVWACSGVAERRSRRRYSASSTLELQTTRPQRRHLRAQQPGHEKRAHSPPRGAPLRAAAPAQLRQGEARQAGSAGQGEDPHVARVCPEKCRALSRRARCETTVEEGGFATGERGPEQQQAGQGLLRHPVTLAQDCRHQLSSSWCTSREGPAKSKLDHARLQGRARRGYRARLHQPSADSIKETMSASPVPGRRGASCRLRHAAGRSGEETAAGGLDHHTASADQPRQSLRAKGRDVNPAVHMCCCSERGRTLS